MPEPAFPTFDALTRLGRHGPAGMMWRCSACARIHLCEQPTPAPPACLGCGGALLEDVTPLPRRPERPDLP